MPSWPQASFEPWEPPRARVIHGGHANQVRTHSPFAAAVAQRLGEPILIGEPGGVSSAGAKMLKAISGTPFVPEIATDLQRSPVSAAAE